MKLMETRELAIGYGNKILVQNINFCLKEKTNLLFIRRERGRQKYLFENLARFATRFTRRSLLATTAAFCLYTGGIGAQYCLCATSAPTFVSVFSAGHGVDGALSLFEVVSNAKSGR